MRFRTHRAIPALLASVLFACASAAAPPAAPPPAPATPAEAAPALFEPSPAALRASEHVELSGRELGTMWTFENAPLAYWAERYDFRPDERWLEHARLSSVRYGQICSASFVSPDGLVMTNHHCARECVEQVSQQGGTDYVVEGFVAKDRTEERLCPGLYLDQLVEIRDVTDRVEAAAPAGATGEAAAEAHAQAMESIADECESASDRTCQVVSLFHGGQYQLYVYQRYQPVKLVFAPELQAGFYGGDPDNFTYPRYALDVSFVRAYAEDGTTPAATPHHFAWDADGAAEGELVFVTGNPGSTSRLITVAHLLYEQQYRHPFLVGLLEGQRSLLQEIASRGPDAERAVRQDLFEIENSLKAFTGQLEGLRDTLLVATKIRWEREFRAAVDADPALRARFGDVWNRLAQIQATKFAISPRLNLANPSFIQSPHLMYAAQLVEYVQEMGRPESERSPEFRQQAPQLEQLLTSASQADPAISQAMLGLQLAMAARWLKPGDPLYDALFQPGESAEAAARRIATESAILDPAYRRQLIGEGVAGLERSTDPLIRFALAAAPIHEELSARWAETTAAESAQRERLAKALFAVYGTDTPPDATFTLRISDGVVAGYPYNGTLAPPHTTFFGLFGRAAAFRNEMPFTLPATFEARRAEIDLSTPLNFVSTNDITGGNSGSPVIDREGRVVGIAFDGNIQQLPNEFVFRDVAARTVSVHSAGIIGALRSVYQADALVRELLGR